MLQPVLDLLSENLEEPTSPVPLHGYMTHFEETRGKGWTVKVIERAGVKLAHQVPGLKEPTECKKEDCFIHISGGKGDCRKEGVMYKGSCLTCIEKGPSSEVNKEGEVVMLPAPPLAPPPLAQ